MNWPQLFNTPSIGPLPGPIAGAASQLGQNVGNQIGKNAVTDLTSNGLASMPATLLIGLLAVMLVIAGVWSLVGGTTVKVVTTAAKAA